MKISNLSTGVISLKFEIRAWNVGVKRSAPLSRPYLSCREQTLFSLGKQMFLYFCALLRIWLYFVSLFNWVFVRLRRDSFIIIQEFTLTCSFTLLVFHILGLTLKSWLVLILVLKPCWASFWVVLHWVNLWLMESFFKVQILTLYPITFISLEKQDRHLVDLITMWKVFRVQMLNITVGTQWLSLEQHIHM